MRGYLVDTDVWINFLRGKEEDMALLLGLGAMIGLSAYTLTELLAGYRNQTERAKIKDLQASFPVYAVTEEVAVLAGELLQRYRGQGIGVVDATNAAVCRIHALTLVTHNLKHYRAFLPQLAIFTG